MHIFLVSARLQGQFCTDLKEKTSILLKSMLAIDDIKNK
jgi:hypothetical protein